MDSDLQYILGALEDGCLYIDYERRDYRVVIVQKNRDWLEYSLKPRFRKLFNVRTVIRKRKNGLWELRIYSREVVEALRNYLYNLDNIELDIHYIAGFYDAEGDKALKRIRIWSKNLSKLKRIAKILEKYMINYSIYLDDKRHNIYCLEVTAYSKIRFLKIIPLEHPKIMAHAHRPRKFRRA